MSRLSEARKRVRNEVAAYAADIGVSPWSRRERLQLAISFAFSQRDKCAWFNRKSLKSMDRMMKNDQQNL
jgi:hypothetical protein